MYQSNKSGKEGEIGTALLFVKLFLQKKLSMQFQIIIKRTIINIFVSLNELNRNGLYIRFDVDFDLVAIYTN